MEYTLTKTSIRTCPVTWSSTSDTSIYVLWDPCLIEWSLRWLWCFGGVPSVGVDVEADELGLVFPSSEEEWRGVAKEFECLWQFPNCVGAIDGKHIQIKKPRNSGSYYYNYKGNFSVVLMAIANAKYEFIMVHCGTNGRVSDGGVLSETKFYEKLINKKLCMPDPTEPHATNVMLPYTFVGDQAFPLTENLMKPYPDKNLTREQKMFNYRLSRARRVSENAFGIMASRFRIFHTIISINFKVVFYRKIVAVYS
ncbi:unnamed protein product [Acanthoscelides obtectus]|uniref:DDE Tnp4 domain-containing protein n=1 Tax=Acanthoscelides obtectus TaxID=200917 RepID=A0A9P0KHI7_ACAOB|nr:unnamed protein product [Acanthoscelides obtectus]CAK1630650.1 Protein ALP1-like [Acanthoscelides obtectus]